MDKNKFMFILSVLLFVGLIILPASRVDANDPYCSGMKSAKTPHDNCFPSEGMPQVREQKHLEQLRLLKLLELLDLDENQETEFIRVFHSFRKNHRNISMERSSLIDTLAKGLKDKTMSDQEIYELVGRIEELETTRNKLENDFLQDAKKILNPEQYGRLIVFRERFEYELLEGVRSFWERRRMRQGGGGPGRLGPGSPRPPLFNDH